MNKKKNEKFNFDKSQKSNTLLNINSFKESFHHILATKYFKTYINASMKEIYLTLAHIVANSMKIRWLLTQNQYAELNKKMLYTFNEAYNLGKCFTWYTKYTNLKGIEEAIKELDINLASVVEEDDELLFGDSYLSRSISDSLAVISSHGIPAVFYGLKYDMPTFKQHFIDGIQYEQPMYIPYDHPFIIRRTNISQIVHFGGIVMKSENNRYAWANTQTVKAIAHDVMIPGYKNNVINTLRLWEAIENVRNIESDSFSEFIKDIITSSNISKLTRVFKPPSTKFNKDESLFEYRLQQHYFMIAASVGDIIDQFISRSPNKEFDFEVFKTKVSFDIKQDTNSLLIVELIRVLIDKFHIPWDLSMNFVEDACTFTFNSMRYAQIDEWQMSLFSRWLPRHLQIIRRIHRDFIQLINSHWPGDSARQQSMAIIHSKRINMAYLAIVCCGNCVSASSVNAEIVSRHQYRKFYEMWPCKFYNCVCGIAQRMSMLIINPQLSETINKYLQSDKVWIYDLQSLYSINSLQRDYEFIKSLTYVKEMHKRDCLLRLKDTYDLPNVDPTWMFDFIYAPITQSNRTLLAIFYIISCYNKLNRYPDLNFAPRLIIMMGKAIPGSTIGKLIIKLFISVAKAVNSNENVKNKLICLYLKDETFSLERNFYLSCDLIEYLCLSIDDKFNNNVLSYLINGALMLGTPGGLRTNIMAELDATCYFKFGHNIETLFNNSSTPSLARDIYDRSQDIREIISQVNSEFFLPKVEKTGSYKIFINSLMDNDKYNIIVDYESYTKAQFNASILYLDETLWHIKTIASIGSISQSSMDIMVSEFRKNMWKMGKKKRKLVTQFVTYATEKKGVEDGQFNMNFNLLK